MEKMVSRATMSTLSQENHHPWHSASVANNMCSLGNFGTQVWPMSMAAGTRDRLGEIYISNSSRKVRVINGENPLVI